MFVIRDASSNDIDGLYRLASYLNSMNLPADRKAIEGLLRRSENSFSQKLAPLEREYLFVLEDCTQHTLLGTSMIIAQHGTPEAPHIYFEVLRNEKYSASLNKHFVHQVLKIGYSYNGPTEIGGIVLDPAYRGNSQKFGKQLSYVRFLYIAKHPKRFRGRIIAELMPPLESDGTSLLWESLGRRFTGLTYQEADRASQTNKEFIRTLFPSEGIYVALLPEEAQKLIGEVGVQTKGVEKMLKKIGFTYQKRIDPFDGGPHFSARVEDISLIQEFAGYTLGDPLQAKEEQFCLAAIEYPENPTGSRFFCIKTQYRLIDNIVNLPAESISILQAKPGATIGILPFT